MSDTKKAGLFAYISTPIMMIVLYAVASVFFILVIKDFTTVVFFMILAFIFTLSMIIYAIVPYKVKNLVRIINIFLISILLFGLACIMGRQNFQIEGLFFYILTGTFGGVTVHFIMGKIIGPLFTGRSWCSWGCWTLMILELLPYKQSKGWKKGNLKYLRYIHFGIAIIVVAILVFGYKYYIHDPNQKPDQPGTFRALYWFLTGNAFYYLAGIIIAIAFKDNRAFCKYLCPVSLFLKFSNLISVLRIKGSKEKCNTCNKCVDKCLFNIQIPEYTKQGTRVKSSECVMCMKCIAVCPESALKASIGFDVVTKDKLKQY